MPVENLHCTKIYYNFEPNALVSTFTVMPLNCIGSVCAILND